MYGDKLPDDEEVKFILTPVNGSQATTLTLTKAELENVKQFVVNQGGYNIEIILPPGYDLESFFFSGEDFRNIIDKFTDNRTKVNLTIDGGFTEFEISIAKREKILNSVEIKSTGLPEGKLVKYTLTKDGKAFTSINGIFRGLEPGSYTLTV